MARKKKEKSTPDGNRVVALSDVGTPELHKRLPVVIEGEGEKRRATVLDHALLYYQRRKEVTRAQFNAGMFLLQDYEVSHQHKTAFSFMRADLGISVTVMPDPENPHTAMERYMRAFRTLPPVGQKLAWEVIILGNLVSEVRILFPGWSKKNNGMDRFREVLDQLEDFYTEDRKAANARRKRIEDEKQRELETLMKPRTDA